MPSSTTISRSRPQPRVPCRNIVQASVAADTPWRCGVPRALTCPSAGYPGWLLALTWSPNVTSPVSALSV
jgi:hypothetical protein